MSKPIFSNVKTKRVAIATLIFFELFNLNAIILLNLLQIQQILDVFIFVAYG